MTVDRIENGIAVIEGENGEHFEVPLSELPDGTREGSLLRKTESGYELDIESERELRKKLAERTRRLFKK